MIKKHVFSFKNAVTGIVWTFKTQSNIKIHLFLSVFSILAGIKLEISFLEFIIIFVLIGVGLAIETLNTAIEEAIDALHKDYSEQIKIAKDASAAAMLIFAVTALFIAGLIFMPRIILLITNI
ncbi:hypothetical protein A2954_03675 [Candidatus Roizmanbacteria bacterium RIFCSPLOWO2_01_FULL_37_12]|uniref:Diacylglycerol kinase n=1 Tax=Candidatus Roizmanbacteria bacterium RIFCSPLOWO2_01_FULL_37_12 TaxID=1802056 RepID=A0A1F7IEK5_9BACT|nr:MAG: hypothetical protein A3D76_05195 [Candidatus Roizmanbacteria bacterium RIFCSPHIGHO2_02_FULL_37_9b]OGK41789.1 MAG: hypothetical protein A2954_03675 [Candidatus Roizmanbacteria bacterium RIFCSPLOWO2_01_FULL_37_12]